MQLAPRSRNNTANNRILTGTQACDDWAASWQQRWSKHDRNILDSSRYHRSANMIAQKSTCIYDKISPIFKNQGQQELKNIVKPATRLEQNWG